MTTHARSTIFATRSLVLTCLLTLLVSTLCACSRPARETLRVAVPVETARPCLQSLGRPPAPRPVKADAECPPQFALCLDRENAANLAITVAQYVSWIDRATALCGATSPSTSPADTSKPSPVDGAASPSTSAPSAGAPTRNADADHYR